MGGCVVSCMSAANSSKQVENRHITAFKQRPNLSKAVRDGDANESSIIRTTSSADLSLDAVHDMQPAPGYKTIITALKDIVEEAGDRNAMAYRPWDHIEKTEIEDGGKKKPWELIHLKETQYISFKELWKRITSFGSGLAALGLRAGSRIGIFEDTRPEWLTTLYGMWTQGLIGVTLYANLGEDALEYAIKESALPAIVCNGKNVKNVLRITKKAGIPTPIIIFLDAIPAGTDLGGVACYDWKAVMNLGKDAPEPVLPDDPDATALIMYTSGTTGDPKGVVFSHENCICAVRIQTVRLEEFINYEDANYVCYLPLAHIYEFASENCFLLRKSTLCFGHPRTLTDAAARPHGDLAEYKPLLLTAVPRVFDTIRKAVLAKLPLEGTLKRRVFDRAYHERKLALQKGYETPYWNEKVFAGPKALLGGRCKELISGGAPLSASTHEFMSIVFGCGVSQGYGLTETCSICTLQRFYDLKTDNIGGLFPMVEVKLRDVEGWKHTNPQPQGEICVRGPIVAKGYYNQPAKTKEAFSADGWFFTGDVAELEPNGSLRLIGRTKALAKNALGEYIALEALEAVYTQNELAIPNGVCVLVNPHKAYIAALVLTDEKKAMKFAAANHIQGSWPSILETARFQEKAAVSLAETAQGAGRQPFERVKTVRILNEEWTPENDVLTAAMKLKRRVIDQKYSDIIGQLFFD